MNDSLKIFDKIYKPYRLTKKNNITIAETTNGNYIIKTKGDNDINSLYKYLSSRNFDSFPKLIDGNRDEYNVYEYIEDTKMPIEQKVNDMMGTIADLHNKTSYYKEVTLSQYQEVYDNIVENIKDTRNKYDDLVNEFKMQIYPSPSGYLLLRNSTKIYDALEYALQKTNVWFNQIKDSKKQRVAVIHNNLTIDHFIKGNRDYLISWERSKVDNPVLDLINLYKNDYLSFDFSELIKKYNNSFPLLESEINLFLSVISIPPISEFGKSEINNCYSTRKLLDYIYKTELFIESYQNN